MTLSQAQVTFIWNEGGRAATASQISFNFNKLCKAKAVRDQMEL